MIVGLVFLFIIIFFVLAAVAKKNTGTTPSFDDLGKASLQIIVVIGFFVVFILLPLILLIVSC